MLPTTEISKNQSTAQGLHLEVPRVRSRSPPSNLQSNQLPPYLKDPELRNLERTDEVFALIEREHHISYKLPNAKATAGRVLAHASNVFESLKARKDPMSFKFGITHCAYFRWYHKPWGYQHTVERFSHMVIVFASPGPVGPAFLEAALIDKFGSYPASPLPKIQSEYKL